MLTAILQGWNDVHSFFQILYKEACNVRCIMPYKLGYMRAELI